MAVLQTTILYSKMIKLSHSLFALPFAGIGLVQAMVFQGSIDGMSVLLVAICMVSARSAAMGMNRLADRYFDANNPRTSNRELPAGKLGYRSVAIFILGSSLLFILSCYFLNPLSLILSIPALAITFLYSFSKRFTWLCHLLLGISIGLAPLGAWIGYTGSFNPLMLYWFGGLAFQIAGFDILYAIQDEEFDKKAGLHSIPSRFGIKNSHKISMLFFLLSLVLFYLAGIFSSFGTIYFLLLSMVIILLYKLLHISQRSGKGQLPPLFYQINSYLGVIIFCGVIIELWNQLVVLL